MMEDHSAEKNNVFRAFNDVKVPENVCSDKVYCSMYLSKLKDKYTMLNPHICNSEVTSDLMTKLNSFPFLPSSSCNLNAVQHLRLMFGYIFEAFSVPQLTASLS